MKKLNGIVAIVMIALFTLASCGKYEEGPSISLLPKKTRLVGTWTVENLFYDGVENTTGLALLEDLEMTLESDGTGAIYMWGFDGTAEWEFSDDKTMFRIRTNMGTGFGEWFESKILRLTMSEFWVSETEETGGTTHTTETHYVKQ